MSRLIDIDQVIKDVLHQSAHEALVGHPENARGLLYAVERMKAMPTAYDVEKTIKRLEELKDCHYIHLVNARVVVRDAMEIVNGGGKDE